MLCSTLNSKHSLESCARSRDKLWKTVHRWQNCCPAVLIFMYSVILQFVSALFSTKQQAVLSCAGSRDKLWKTVHRWQNCCPAVLIFMYSVILQFVSALFSAKQQAVLSCAGNRDKLWKTIIIIVYKYVCQCSRG